VRFHYSYLTAIRLVSLLLEKWNRVAEWLREATLL
jgi:hypothetical protein